MKTSYNKDLGLLFDACQVVTCKTARHETWIAEYVHTGTESEDFQYIEDVLAKLSPISSKLILLGYRNKKQNSLINQLFTSFVNDSIGNWSQEYFIEYVTNEDRLLKETAKFYLNNVSVENAVESISNSTYSSDIKSCLYELFLFTQKYIELIRDTLHILIREVSAYHAKHAYALLECHDSFDSDIFLSLLPKKMKAPNHVYSFSLITRYTTFYGAKSDLNWLILGSEYKKVSGSPEQAAFDLAAFGNAFGDKIRVKIVELIREHGELTLADLSKEIGVVNTIAIYHLDILKKENLMLYRHIGRKVLYSLNTAQIKKGLAEIEKLCGINPDEIK